jgi:hypothetical protein
MLRLMRLWLFTAAATLAGGVFEDFQEMDETGGPADQGGSDEHDLGDGLEDGPGFAGSMLCLLGQVVRGLHFVQPLRRGYATCPLIPCHTWPFPIRRRILPGSPEQRKKEIGFVFALEARREAMWSFGWWGS